MGKTYIRRSLGYLSCLLAKRTPRNAKTAFIYNRIPKNGKILDVGCGNNSPYNVKRIRPDVYYVGLDIGVYNQSSEAINYADELIYAQPEKFHQAIEENEYEYDVILSTHNLEHCNDFVKVLNAMSKALKEGGLLYLTFPCEESVHFPKRKNSLNFYDDSSHKDVIPYLKTISVLKQTGMTILFAKKRFRPFLPLMVGLFYEPLAKLTKIQLPIMNATWALYGFETVIIAKKK